MSLPAQSDSDPLPSPETVAAEAFRAIEEKRWEHLVSLIDPADAQRFRDDRVRWWVEPRPVLTITAEQMRRRDPDMPLAVAEYQAEQFRRKQEEPASCISDEFAGIESPGQLASLPAIDVLTRYFQAHDPAVRLKALLAQHGKDLPADFPVELMVGPSYEVIGSVAEGDSLAHVVYRRGVGVVPAEEDTDDQQPETSLPLNVATLRRTPAGWRLTLAHDLFGLEGWVFGVDLDESED